jgi:DNA replication protein DnaC
MTTTTLDRLRGLRLGAMAEAYLTHQQDPALTGLTFDERFSMLVDAEHLYRATRAQRRRLQEARLRLPQACLEDVDASPKRGLDRAMLRHLATGRWITDHQPVVITGATGVGKTFLACALGQPACRHGARVLYRRVPRLVEDLLLAHADGSYTTLLARLARTDVLVLDDWGLAPLADRQRHDLLEVLDDRDGTRSTVITSQLPRDRWHDYLGEPTVADAILDRVLHRAHTIDLTGPSRRKGPHTGPPSSEA